MAKLSRGRAALVSLGLGLVLVIGGYVPLWDMNARHAQSWASVPLALLVLVGLVLVGRAVVLGGVQLVDRAYPHGGSRRERASSWVLASGGLILVLMTLLGLWGARSSGGLALFSLAVLAVGVVLRRGDRSRPRG